jgi:hypothetical protein
LAGVLLGKTSLNSLYGLMGGLPQTANQFGYPDSAGGQGLAAGPGCQSGERNKIVVLPKLNARCRSAGGWHRGGGF